MSRRGRRLARYQVGAISIPERTKMKRSPYGIRRPILVYWFLGSPLKAVGGPHYSRVPISLFPLSGSTASPHHLRGKECVGKARAKPFQSLRESQTAPDPPS